MTTTTETRQQRRARERAEAKRLKKASKTPAFKLDANNINSINEAIVQDLQDPKFGFKLEHQWETDDGYMNDGKFSIYTTQYNRSLSKRIDILSRAFGSTVEAALFDNIKYLEHGGKDNPFTGAQTYEPFDGGEYKLCIGVWEMKSSDYSFGGADEVSLPATKYALVPMLQHGWKPDEPRMFGRAYGDTVPLNNLQSMIARANFSTLYTSPHNPGRLQNLSAIYQGMFGSVRTDATDYNWLMAYTTTYHMYRSTLGGGNGSSDVKVTAGKRDDVTKDAMNLHRVFD